MAREAFSVDDEPGSFSLYQMIKANRDMDSKQLGDLVKTLSRLRVGQSIRVGGGAGASSIITRVR